MQQLHTLTIVHYNNHKSSTVHPHVETYSHQLNLHVCNSYDMYTNKDYTTIYNITETPASRIAQISQYAHTTSSRP